MPVAPVKKSPVKACRSAADKAANPLLNDLAVDFLYHLGFSTELNLPLLFGDTKFVVMGGSADRMESLGRLFAKKFRLPECAVIGPIGKTERCSIYKVGPVTLVSHGMGVPSLSIMMNEIIKVMRYAGADNPSFIRIGTSGGVGVKPGTAVISSHGISAVLEAKLEHVECGKVVEYSTQADEGLAQGLEAMAQKLGVAAEKGATMCADDFFEGQGRLDGACATWYTEQDKMEFLQKAYKLGVRNIEMESTFFLSFARRAGHKAAVVCATLLNRLNGDQVTSTPQQLAEFTDNALSIVVTYVAEHI